MSFFSWHRRREVSEAGGWKRVYCRISEEQILHRAEILELLGQVGGDLFGSAFSEGFLSNLGRQIDSGTARSAKELRKCSEIPQ